MTTLGRRRKIDRVGRNGQAHLWQARALGSGGGADLVLPGNSARPRCLHRGVVRTAAGHAPAGRDANDRTHPDVFADCNADANARSYGESSPDSNLHSNAHVPTRTHSNGDSYSNSHPDSYAYS